MRTRCQQFNIISHDANCEQTNIAQFILVLNAKQLCLFLVLGGRNTLAFLIIGSKNWKQSTGVPRFQNMFPSSLGSIVSTDQFGI